MSLVKGMSTAAALGGGHRAAADAQDARTILQAIGTPYDRRAAR
jgi:hypothetical protein